MAFCSCISGCPFFNDRMENKPALADMYKKSYCQGAWEKCARFMVLQALGKPCVPTDLFPNQLERATQLLDAH
ncbi:MAG: hypothetical protein WB699_05520 [Bacteroidota bacterium]